MSIDNSKFLLQVARFSLGIAAAGWPTYFLDRFTEFGAQLARNFQMNGVENELIGVGLTGTVYKTINTVHDYVMSNKDNFIYSPTDEFTKGFALTSSVVNSMSISNLFYKEKQENISWKKQLTLWAPGVLTALYLSYYYSENPLIPLAVSSGISALNALHQNSVKQQQIGIVLGAT